MDEPSAEIALLLAINQRQYKITNQWRLQRQHLSGVIHRDMLVCKAVNCVVSKLARKNVPWLILLVICRPNGVQSVFRC